KSILQKSKILKHIVNQKLRKVVNNLKLYFIQWKNSAGLLHMQEKTKSRSKNQFLKLIYNTKIIKNKDILKKYFNKWLKYNQMIRRKIYSYDNLKYFMMLITQVYQRKHFPNLLSS